MPKTCPICGTTYQDTSAFCPADGTTLRADDSDSDLIGSVIADRYLVSKLLGEGGMGRVYLAGHVRLPQQAAIKVLHPSMVQDSAAVARFNREAANAARIEHDRVARVFDFGETSTGLVYLAMEFVPGRTLGTILEERCTLPPARAANLIFQIAEGLEAAHRISIVHRDLKPDNIMVVTDEFGIDRAKVVDFGIAKAMDGTDGSRTKLTQAGISIGTPEFMSPEQVFGEPLDARSDVYALALVGYQMLTGLLPFETSTPERSLTARIVSAPRTLAEAAPGVAWPAALQTAFDQALAREPGERTSSALEFADAVVAATEAWMGTPVLRTRTPLSSAALLTAAANASVSNASVPTAPMQQAIPTEGGLTTRSSKSMVFGVVGALAVAVVAVFVLKLGGRPSTGSARTASPPVEATSTTTTTTAPTTGGNTPAVTPPSAIVTPRTTPASTAAPKVNAVATEAVSPTAGAPTNAEVTSRTSEADAARRSLDAVKRALAAADESDAASVAKEAIPQLKQLLDRLTSATDSTWAYIYLANAYGMANDPSTACGPLRTAKRLATSDAQLRAVTNLVNSGAFTCAP